MTITATAHEKSLEPRSSPLHTLTSTLRAAPLKHVYDLLSHFISEEAEAQTDSGASLRPGSKVCALKHHVPLLGSETEVVA